MNTNIDIIDIISTLSHLHHLWHPFDLDAPETCKTSACNAFIFSQKCDALGSHSLTMFGEQNILPTLPQLTSWVLVGERRWRQDIIKFMWGARRSEELTKMCNPERYAAQPQPCLSVKLNLVNQQLHTEGGSAERGLNWISGSGFVGLGSCPSHNENLVSRNKNLWLYNK